MAAYHDPTQLAKALGGEFRNGQILAPGPGHSATDRSLSIRIDANAPHGFVVHSFASDDPIKCRDYIYERAGLPAWKPNGGKPRRASSDAIDAAIMAATAAVGQQSKSPRGQIVATYDGAAPGGTLLYQVLRYEPKDFRGNVNRTAKADGFGSSRGWRRVIFIGGRRY